MKEKETLCSEELEKINSFTRRKMSPDEIYTFPVVLCDNEIDRDCEKFTRGLLKKWRSSMWAKPVSLTIT